MSPTEGLNIVIFLFLGLLVAAAVQLLVTTLGLALGLGLWGWSAQRDHAADPNDKSLPITPLVGFGLALSTTLVLFTAALLTTKFSGIVDPQRGAVFGVILWATYWVVLVWFSSTRLFGFANAVLGTAIASSRQLITLMGQMFRPQPSDSADPEQAILQELVAEVSQLTDLQRQLPTLLNHQRKTLIAEITERTDLSADEAESVVAGLEPGADLAAESYSSSTASGLLNQLDLPSWQQLVRQLLNQVDLSSVDLETLWQQVQAWREGEDDEDSSHQNVILLDAEDFVCRAPTWSLQPEAIQQEFYERIYDPEAAAESIQAELSQLTREDFLEWLQHRQDLSPEQLDPIADQLCQVQASVLERVSGKARDKDGEPPSQDYHDNSSALQGIEDKLLAYCRYTNLDVLTADSVIEKVETLRQEFDLPPEAPLASPSGLNVDQLADVLGRRQGISETQQQTLIDALVSALGDTPSPQEGDNAWMQQVNHRLTDYFRSIDWSAVSLEDIKPEVVSQLRSLDLKGDLDWQSLGAHLQVPDEVKTDLLDWLQTTGQTLSRQPRRWAIRIGKSAQSFTQYLIRQITHYLKFQEKSAFRPDQIAEDLTTILKHAVELLPNPSDWEVLSDLKHLIDPRLLQETLENRRDMTTEQIQEVLGWFDNAWQTVTRQVLDWSQTLWAETRHWLSTRSDNLDGARHYLVDRIADTRQDLQDRAAQVKAEIKEQADAVRRQVAIAAAWLFISLLTSGGAAMAAGWLAVRY